MLIQKYYASFKFLTTWKVLKAHFLKVYENLLFCWPSKKLRESNDRLPSRGSQKFCVSSIKEKKTANRLCRWIHTRRCANKSVERSARMKWENLPSDTNRNRQWKKKKITFFPSIIDILFQSRLLDNKSFAILLELLFYWVYAYSEACTIFMQRHHRVGNHYKSLNPQLNTSFMLSCRQAHGRSSKSYHKRM